jgi:putative endonuclease
VQGSGKLLRQIEFTLRNETNGCNAMHRLYYVYILASRRNGTLYIGVTNDLSKRVWQHRQGVASAFTRKYGATRLVYFEEFGDIYLAIARETRLKKYKRAWKMTLIQRDNVEWRDLAADWYA